jgi:hypothetical protein
LGNSIVIQSLPNGKTIHTFAIPKGPVVKLMWEPGGNTILYQPDHKQTLTRIDATTGKQLPLSNAPTPTQLPHWELHPTLPYLAFFDPNKKTLTLFDYPSMTVRHTYTSQYHDIFAFHPTRAQIAIRTKKTEISVRDIISDKVLHTITDTQIDSLSINASDLLVYTYGKRYIVWDLAQKKQLHILQAAGLYLGGGYEAHHPKGTFMLLPGYYPLSVVKEWNLRTGKSIRTIRVGGDVFRKASYAPNGQHIGFTSRFYVTKSSQIEFYSCCPGDGTFCWSSGTCQILSNDAKHCGTCDNACSNGQTCNNGLCQ